jgi:hypothetical protein
VFFDQRTLVPSSAFRPLLGGRSFRNAKTANFAANSRRHRNGAHLGCDLIFIGPYLPQGVGHILSKAK